MALTIFDKGGLLCVAMEGGAGNSGEDSSKARSWLGNKE